MFLIFFLLGKNERTRSTRARIPKDLAFRLQDSQQFNIEIQGGTTRDDSASSTVSIGQSRWKNNLSAFSNLHLCKGLVPSSDHLSLADGKGKGSSAVTRRIEFADRIESVEPSGVVGLLQW